MVVKGNLWRNFGKTILKFKNRLSNQDIKL